MAAAAPAGAPAAPAHVVSRGDRPRWLRQHFLENDPHYVPWVGARVEGGWGIGTGGQGFAGLWVRVNHGRVVDRLAVKESYLANAEWWDPTMWDVANWPANGSRDYNRPIDHARPLEAGIHQRVYGLIGGTLAPNARERHIESIWAYVSCQQWIDV